MSRSEKAAEAQALRSEGLKYREIAERMGFGISYVQALVKDPDGSALAVRHAKARERNRGACKDCGGPMGLDATSAGHLRCLSCEQASRASAKRERIARWFAMRQEGMDNKDIAAAEGVLPPVVATQLQRAAVERFGFKWVPTQYAVKRGVGA